MAPEHKALIIGYGSIGRRHMENLHRLGVRRFGLLRRTARIPDDLPADDIRLDLFTELPHALAGGYDIAVVCNPTAMHLATTRDCLAAGCHVYVEKPLAATPDGVDALLTLEHERVAVVGCQFRFHPHVERMRDWIQQGRVGTPLYAHLQVGQYLPDWHPDEDYREGYAAREELGGGVVLTLIHEIDYADWLLGPLHVTHAAGGPSTPLDIPVDDMVAATLETEAGRPVHLAMDYWRRPAQRRVEIVGTEGHLVWDYFAGTLTFTDRNGKAETDTIPAGWDRNDMFLDCVREFLDCIDRETSPRTPLADGARALELALSIKQHTGGASE